MDEFAEAAVVWKMLIVAFSIAGAVAVVVGLWLAFG